MTTYDPSTAPRQLGQGYKNDGWIVSLPPEGSDTLLMLDTGIDSIAIARIPDGRWDRSARPRAVHAHDGYDETMLISRGSGTLYHGPDAAHIVATRFDGRAVVVVPAGTWHHIAMDPGVTAQGTCFFTLAGTVIESFSIQMEIIAKGRVTFADLEVVHPRRVDGTTWTRPPAQALPPQARPAPAARARLVDALPAGVTANVRIVPFEAPPEGELPLPLDTGRDSLFIMAGPPPEPTQGEPGPVRMPELPEFVDVHRHPDVDEYIIRENGAGYLLNGAVPRTVTLTPFRGPCVIVMPAGAFHRIVQTEDPGGGASILVYADRRAVVERYEVIMARTSVATFAGPDEPGARP